MHRQRVPAGRANTPSTPSLDQHLGTPFPTPDLVLLCSFGIDLDVERTGHQLRDILLAAGFAAREARHLVRVSPLLRRCPGGGYQIRPFER